MTELPLYLDLGDVRCVHACWDPSVITKVAERLDSHGCFTESALIESFRKGAELRDLVDIAIRGSEVTLPKGLGFVDSDGHMREKSRAKWWADRQPLSLQELISDEVELDADLDIPEIHLAINDPNPTPVFFGHYWMKGQPRLVSNKAVCLDFSVASKGALCAYSWRGEPELSEDNLTWVSNGLEVDQLMKAGQIANRNVI
jgi:hypothetical protein